MIVVEEAISGGMIPVYHMDDGSKAWVYDHRTSSAVVVGGKHRFVVPTEEVEGGTPEELGDIVRAAIQTVLRAARGTGRLVLVNCGMASWPSRRPVVVLTFGVFYMQEEDPLIGPYFPPMPEGTIIPRNVPDEWAPAEMRELLTVAKVLES